MTRFLWSLLVDKIKDFIQRRFPENNNWLTGNCFFFALILSTVFHGRIVYDPIDGHFLFHSNGGYYDWSGRREDYNSNQIATFVDWKTYEQKDPLHWSHIVRDCIL